MEMDDYQQAAKTTDRVPTNVVGDKKLRFLILGLVDEIGQISGIAKKDLRHGTSAADSTDKIMHRLGDALWYLTLIADHLGINLSEVANRNLEFLQRRWNQQPDSFFSSRREFYSSDNERLPDKLEFLFERVDDTEVVQMRLSTPLFGQIGDVVDDNEYREDNYRFHDVIHIALMACLRWSPVFRKLLARKRKSNTTVDRVEDGAKARDIEEALSRMIFMYFQQNSFLESAASVDTNFLRDLRIFSGEREVSWVTESQWEDAMMQAAAAMRQMIKAKNGVLLADIGLGRIEFRPTA